MGKAKKTRKFAQVKRMISSRDGRLKQNQEKEAEAAKKRDMGEIVREMCVPVLLRRYLCGVARLLIE